MSKRRKAVIPQFGSTRTAKQPLKPGQVIAEHAPPPPPPRIKAQSIPLKTSGHRGS